MNTYTVHFNEFASTTLNAASEAEAIRRACANRGDKTIDRVECLTAPATEAKPSSGLYGIDAGLCFQQGRCQQAGRCMALQCCTE